MNSQQTVVQPSVVKPSVVKPSVVKPSVVKPSAAQQAWLELGYGMFIHFGPNTFAGTAWGDGTFRAIDFRPAELDCRQWAGVAAEAGMRYAVLTAKHHDGFCLWPTSLTDYSIKNTPDQRDVVGEFVGACRAAGIRPGLYYSLWDRNCSVYDDDAAYAAFMRGQVNELLSSYGDIVELWFDGGWDKEHPTREWPYDVAWEEDPQIDRAVLRGSRWEWRALYDSIKAVQPDCIVLNNSGSDRPGTPRTFPLDARTSEHLEFVFHDKLFQADQREVWRDDDGQELFLPLEYSTSLNPHWFHTGKPFYLHPSAHTIAGWKETARQANANFLLNVGPNRQGLIPDYHRHFLIEATRL
jgi:alpha-L-fucosidase